jgi:hypothetical protein
MPRENLLDARKDNTGNGKIQRGYSNRNRELLSHAS